jgi:hypothetical protein
MAKSLFDRVFLVWPFSKGPQDKQETNNDLFTMSVMGFSKRRRSSSHR